MLLTEPSAGGLHEDIA
jgi:hypothetical protein